MASGKIPKDQLSIDGPFVHKHSWLFGTWQYVSRYSERTDICKFCECERHVTRFYSKGRMITAISCYVRSNIHFSPQHKPDCWRAKEPK